MVNGRRTDGAQGAGLRYAAAPDGARIAYHVAGGGPPLVLLAGQACNHHWWDPVVGDFARRFLTVTLDYRGTGASDPAPDGCSTSSLAADVISVLDEIGVDRSRVYGTSMGGRVAQRLAIEYPDRVDSLVLGCTSPGDRHGVRRDGAVDSALGASDRAAARRFLLELMYTPVWLAGHTGPYPVLGDPTMTSADRRAHRRASARHDAWDLLPDIGAPTLVIHGTDDRLNPTANAALLAQRIPMSRLELLPGARHAYFHEFRQRASDLVTTFLQRPA